MSTLVATAITIIAHTPLWVWPLYLLLLLLGFQGTRDRVVPLWRFLILPAVVTFLTILTIVGAGVGGLPAVLPGLATGFAGGWQLERDGATRWLGKGRLWVAGDWSSFTQIAAVLVFRYAASVAPVFAPALYGNATWHATTLFISGVLSALFLGRSGARLRVYFSAARQSV